MFCFSWSYLPSLFMYFILCVFVAVFSKDLGKLSGFSNSVRVPHTVLSVLPLEREDGGGYQSLCSDLDLFLRVVTE